MNQSIIKTLSYSDLFDFPLKACEIWKTLIWDKKNLPSQNTFERSLFLLSGFSFKNGYYFLNGREKIVVKRMAREIESFKKMPIALFYARILGFFPTIRLIGISGSLAVNNAGYNDDIDLFIVTRKNSLWITRFFSIITMILLGRIRFAKTKNKRNKICLNMLVSENSLLFPKDVYTAHEIAQLRVVVNKNNTYQQMLHANKWVYSYLPNAPLFEKQNYNNKKSGWIENLLFFPEAGFYIFQYLYMRKKMTKETVTFCKAMFHPSNYREGVLSFYHKRLPKSGYQKYRVLSKVRQKEPQLGVN